MNIVNIPIISSDSLEEIKSIFKKTYLSNLLTFEGIPLKIFPEDFNHICYEDKEGDSYKNKFSFKKARKLLLIKELCDKNIPYILIYQINRPEKTVCVLAECVEFALFLIPKRSKKGNYLRIGTVISYGKKVESKIKSQKNKGNIIKKIAEVFL